MSTKVLDRAEVKAVATETGVIEFYALAFSKTPDLMGDIIAPSAADAWLKTFYAAGRPLPISFAHAAVKEAIDPFAIVGSAPADVEHVYADNYGLRVKAQLDVETNATAQQVYSLARRGIIRGASVAYFVPDGGQKRQRDGSTLITKMEILEAGPCLDPANPDAYVISVKTHDGPVTETEGADVEVTFAFGDSGVSFKVGRRHSQATQDAVRSAITSLLTLIEPPTDEEAKDNPDEPQANGEDPDTARIRAEIAAAQEVSVA